MKKYLIKISIWIILFILIIGTPYSNAKKEDTTSIHLDITSNEFVDEFNPNKDKKNTYREHKAISKSNFSSILQGRTNAYAKYQNKDGLYEPIKPKAGIELKNKREE